MTKEELQGFLTEAFPQVAAEFQIEAITGEGALVRLKVGPQHLRPGGTISGPSMFALADVAVYLALLSRIGPVALAVTTNSAMDFLRKPEAGRDLIAETRILKLGKLLATADVMIRSEEDPSAAPAQGAGLETLVARATMTYAIPPRR